MKTLLFTSLALLLLVNYAQAAPATPNSDMKEVLTELGKLHPKPIEKLSAEEARKQPTPADATKALVTEKKGSFKPMPIAKIHEQMVQGADGMIPARIYTPEGTGPFPVIAYYHGGGFVIATNDTYDGSARALANGAKAIVVAVEYRKAPEHKFPAAHDDAFAAYKWILNNARSFNGDPSRVAVAGESAGGNLALNVAIRARDEKIMIPRHELLIYPVAGNDMNSASYQKNADAKPLNKAMMGWFVKNYTRTPEDANDVRINLLAANFKGLNPATVITAEIDPLMTEGQKLAERMKSQGVSVDYKNYTGVTHEFFGMAPVVSDAKMAQAFATDNLSRAFLKQAQQK